MTRRLTTTAMVRNDVLRIDKLYLEVRTRIVVIVKVTVVSRRIGDKYRQTHDMCR